MTNRQDPNAKKTVHVALTGNTNVGKSTLINALADSYISITTPKPHTTRTVIRHSFSSRGIIISLSDTAGFQPKRSHVQAHIYRQNHNALYASTVILYCLDVTQPLRHSDKTRLRDLLDVTVRQKKPVLIVLNKIDAVKKHQLLPYTAELQACLSDAPCCPPIVMISAQHKDGIDTIKDYLHHYAQTQPSQQSPLPSTSLALRACDMTREHILKQLKGEVPYCVRVVPTAWQEKNHRVTIRQTILISKKTHKAILIGKNGRRIKTIGTAARYRMEKAFAKPIQLFLTVEQDSKT